MVQELTNQIPRRVLTLIEKQENAPGSFGFSKTEWSLDRGVRLTSTGVPGHRYLLERSNDLATWKKFAVITNTSGTATFLDLNATNSVRRFYRLSGP
jgi:hypothetical protein